MRDSSCESSVVAGKHEQTYTSRLQTRNWPAYNKALKRRGSLTLWFDPEMTWADAPTGKRGRQPDYSNAAIQRCLTMKVLFGVALRQATGFVESLLRLIGLGWAVPDFSTLSRRQKALKVNIPYRSSEGPLHLLVDSKGIKVEGEGEWNARKHGGTKRRVWRMIHIGIDEKTLEVRAAEFTTSDVGDAPMLPELLDQIPPEQEIGSVTADGAFDTRKCHEAIAARGAVAIIPPRKSQWTLGLTRLCCRKDRRPGVRRLRAFRRALPGSGDSACYLSTGVARVGTAGRAAPCRSGQRRNLSLAE